MAKNVDLRPTPPSPTQIPFCLFHKLHFDGLEEKNEEEEKNEDKNREEEDKEEEEKNEEEDKTKEKTEEEETDEKKKTVENKEEEKTVENKEEEKTKEKEKTVENKEEENMKEMTPSKFLGKQFRRKKKSKLLGDYTDPMGKGLKSMIQLRLILFYIMTRKI
ncbi:cilia- and flagella-associated protein 251-like [Impatiens glandulifera]|uniref:cilia- and flagella-associated protein 251-like n=1 Tax=Impatiens glandulifera TaxID=253017 RepID=UPI001FB0C7E3|nr:cilia- and flagella-associated protein 251-like [Impatiens glandulifera]